MKSISTITWDIFQKMSEKFLKTTFLSLDKYINHLANKDIFIEWHSIDNWEDLDDEEIYGNIEKLKPPMGKLYIITEVCYKKCRGPFELDASDIREFIIRHLEKYGECFFNGDAIIFSFDYNNIWCFHHEGLYSLIKQEESLRNRFAGF